MPQRPRKDFIVPLLTVIADALAIEGAFLFSYWVRFHSPVNSFIPVTLGIPSLEAYIAGSLIVIPTWILLFHSRRMYATRRNVFFSDEFFAIVRLVFFGMLIVMSATFFYREFSYSRAVFAILAISSVMFISLARSAVLKFEKRWYAHGNDVKDVVIVGTNGTARRVYDSITQNPALGYRVVGFFSINGLDQMETAGSDFLGRISHVPEYVRRHDVDIVLVSLTYKDHPQLYELVRDSEGLNAEIMMVPDMLELMTSRVRIKELYGIPFINIKGVPMTTWNLIVKRGFDLVVSGISIVLASPLVGILAALIKLDSTGPVFYSQERVGLDGRPFRLLKFRTMKVDAETGIGPVWAEKNDPRKTRIGGFLRRFSLDELPQLWNVLTGDMSIVGPRPERPHFVDQFKKEIPKYLDRHRVKTGMTGWAQVNGLRGNAPIEERTKFDVYYVENWSLVFDLKIILKTARAVIFGKDAY
ncbi:MAG: undecaprenyl-phosphate glucose phosphotransferase [Ignavibacteria bacterium GWA2_54_16]|nr:MAG: undecaprenyl-phosphate glucose phosphotransferase [Ignavibacteria bacterium GWA2_54_16]